MGIRSPAQAFQRHPKAHLTEAEPAGCGMIRCKGNGSCRSTVFAWSRFPSRQVFPPDLKTLYV
jgi:hypothetical protein